MLCYDLSEGFWRPMQSWSFACAGLVTIKDSLFVDLLGQRKRWIETMGKQLLAVSFHLLVQTC